MFKIVTHYIIPYNKVASIIAIYNDKFVDLKLHLDRLKTSLNKIDIKINLTLSQIEKISQKIKKLNNLSMGIIYIQITRGNQNPRDHKYTNDLKPNIIIYSLKKDFKKLDKLALKGVKTSLYPDIRWLRSDIKSINAYHVPDSKNLLKLDAMESPFGVPSDLKEDFLNYIDKVFFYHKITC